MKVYQGHSASPGLVMGQVSRLERWHENFATGPFNAEREQRLLENAVRTAQRELDGMADRSGPTEQAIFLFQSMMLEDEGFMNEVKFQIKAGISAAEAMYRAGNRYAEQLAAMEDNAYMQLRSADILDAARRVVNVLTNRPRVWLALDHPVILAAEMLMPSDLFSVPAGMILGLITSEGNKQSHAAIIARAMHIPGVVQVGREFLDDCDGRTVVLDANNGECILDPDAAARQSAITCICEMQRQNEELRAGQSLCGVHREDLELLLDDQPARVFASQGQQRSVVLSLKMAEAAAAARITGEHPVLLLDDVLSELDEGRKQYLLTRMKEKQTFVTSCDDTAFLKTDGEVYRMNGGVLSKA